MVPENTVSSKPEITYPESDKQLRAYNTEKFRWIVTLQGGIDALFKDDPDVFVAANLLWYPVEGNNKLRMAPNVMVVFGRPKGERGSYLQWEEYNIPPQVAFDIFSPGNTGIEMLRNQEFYGRYGVEEYYIYDPDKRELLVLLRMDNLFRVIEPINGWVSPRLAVRFEITESGLELYRPDGRKFSTYLQLETQRQQAEERANRLAEKLRELGIDPDAM